TVTVIVDPSRLQRSDGRRRAGKNDIGIERHHLLDQLREPLVIIASEPQLNLDVAPFQPSELFERLPESCNPPGRPDRFPRCSPAFRCAAFAPPAAALARRAATRPRRRAA